MLVELDGPWDLNSINSWDRRVCTGQVRRLVLILALIAFASGCASSELASLPKSSPDFGEPPESLRSLAVGDNVRIELNKGESIEGEVVAVSSESVTVGRSGNYGYGEIELQGVNILTVERITSGNVWWVAAAVGVVVVVLVIKAFAEYGWN